MDFFLFALFVHREWLMLPWKPEQTLLSLLLGDPRNSERRLNFPRPLTRWEPLSVSWWEPSLFFPGWDEQTASCGLQNRRHLRCLSSRRDAPRGHSMSGSGHGNLSLGGANPEKPSSPRLPKKLNLPPPVRTAKQRPHPLPHFVEG